MAILRSVESGFSQVRTARQGRLTINDYCGRVNAEASSAAGNAITLTGTVSLQHRDTLYDRFGNWFGIINAVIAVFMIVGAIKTKKR